ncbi:MltR family transcriptional regulator [Vibrio salinus]|uniref:MltR family transcriptional regulator n=1 Tax=Vibrio salinus TaxID=2899784 RepID=UPI001E464F7A|nr:MltR family transcriptional regulator [Vibrio salinus]MCE0494720.1 MltR family transcriptional regulator [Vibrio salinus]
MSDNIQESEIIERLNEAPSVRVFFISAVEIFEDAVDMLVQRIFRSDYLAVKAVINPLLDSSGPLGDLSVRIKLLFGLGVLPENVYHDIDAFIHIRNQLNNDAYEYKFSDKKVIAAVKKLTSVQTMGIDQFEQFVAEYTGDTSDEFYQLQLLRQEQVIKSSLALSIVELSHALDKDSPFTSQHH